MSGSRFDDIRRVYNLDSYRRVKEVKGTVSKGFFRKRLVEVTTEVPEPIEETRVRVTNNILGMLEGLLGKKPTIPGIKMEELPQILNSSKTLVISDCEGRRIGGIEYGMIVHSGYFGWTEDYVALNISGDAVSSEQFNGIQVTDALQLKP
jgi:hypothetical protein